MANRALVPAHNQQHNVPKLLSRSANTVFERRLFAENLRRYRSGQPLRNLVDRTLGY